MKTIIDEAAKVAIKEYEHVCDSCSCRFSFGEDDLVLDVEKKPSEAIFIDCPKCDAVSFSGKWKRVNVENEVFVNEHEHPLRNAKGSTRFDWNVRVKESGLSLKSKQKPIIEPWAYVAYESGDIVLLSIEIEYDNFKLGKNIFTNKSCGVEIYFKKELKHYELIMDNDFGKWDVFSANIVNNVLNMTLIRTDAL